MNQTNHEEEIDDLVAFKSFEQQELWGKVTDPKTKKKVFVFYAITAILFDLIFVSYGIIRDIEENDRQSVVVYIIIAIITLCLGPPFALIPAIFKFPKKLKSYFLRLLFYTSIIQGLLIFFMIIGIFGIMLE